MRNSFQHETQAAHRITKAIDAIVAQIERDAPTALSVREVAETAGYSEHHFNRLFSDFTGESTGAFVRRLKLEKAAHLLLADESTSVMRIATRCGFNSHESLTRAFKRYYGISPSDYRRLGPPVEPPCPIERRHYRNDTRLAWHCWPEAHPLRWSMFARKRTMPLAAVPASADYNRLADHVGLLRTRAHPHIAVLETSVAIAVEHGVPTELGTAEHWIGFPVIDPDRVPTVHPLRAMQVPAGEYAMGVVSGPIDTIDDGYAMLYHWIEDNGYRRDNQAGSPHEIIIEIDDHHSPPITKMVINLPVTKA